MFNEVVYLQVKQFRNVYRAVFFYIFWYSIRFIIESWITKIGWEMTVDRVWMWKTWNRRKTTSKSCTGFCLQYTVVTLWYNFAILVRFLQFCFHSIIQKIMKNYKMKKKMKNDFLTVFHWKVPLIIYET